MLVTILLSLVGDCASRGPVVDDTLASASGVVGRRLILALVLATTGVRTRSAPVTLAHVRLSLLILLVLLALGGLLPGLVLGHHVAEVFADRLRGLSRLAKSAMVTDEKKSQTCLGELVDPSMQDLRGSPLK